MSLSPDEIQDLQHAAELLQAIAQRHANDPTAPLVRVGDVVQLKPSADRVFGGLLLRVQRVTPWDVRGYLLRPHRGGSALAWYTYHHGDVERVGHPSWPEPPWGLRVW